jgi:methylated-DNA-[protein]-cysteine S-methyltransferase
MKMKEADIRQRLAADGTLSAFRRRVYEALREVPAGCVTTYGLLAGRIGCRSAQAVGGALRANPYAPEVPCHRVVSADLSIGGFCGHVCGAQICRKIALLKDEGVPLDAEGHLLDAGRVWRFPKGRAG